MLWVLSEEVTDGGQADLRREQQRKRRIEKQLPRCELQVRLIAWMGLWKKWGRGIFFSLIETGRPLSKFLFFADSNNGYDRLDREASRQKGMNAISSFALWEYDTSRSSWLHYMADFIALEAIMC